MEETKIPFNQILGTIFNGRSIEEILIIIFFSATIFVITLVILSAISKKFKLNLLPWVKAIFGKEKGDTKKEEGNKQETNLTINVNTDKPNEEQIENIAHEIVDEIEDDYSSKIMLIISRSILFGEEVFKQNELILIRAQMSVIEARLNLIKSSLIKEYLDILYKRGYNIDINNDASYVIFSNTVHINVHRSMIFLLRQKIKENHLVNYTDEKFEDYIETTRDNLLNDINITFNTSIPSFIDPGKEDINKMIEKKSNYISTVLRDMLLETRSISLEHHENMAEKIKEYNLEMNEIAGVKDVFRKVRNFNVYNKKK